MPAPHSIECNPGKTSQQAFFQEFLNRAGATAGSPSSAFPELRRTIKPWRMVSTSLHPPSRFAAYHLRVSRPFRAPAPHLFRNLYLRMDFARTFPLPNRQPSDE